ncbi:hypothetical protein K466DRAFT_505521 [Polyporus arcularius HHB13444]|uniref:Uncharacterized protein n=1 Tax=Polyporus arcularius HHB13444 TaxID=1314778 RepID=A0A5C3P122_9APHY|nr:hypothetical protein K466DRAFT_505521 [Polyporus arcularius HHB13444]
MVKYNQSSRLTAERQGIIPFVGNLDISTRAQIHNWIYENIPGAKSTFHEWIGRYVVAHAITLLLVQNLRSETEVEDETELLYRAWNLQVSCQVDEEDAASFVDVDAESLRAFEQRLFEWSSESGIAGFEQWGLDAGEHQDRWNPYAGLPSDWSTGGHPDDADELLEVSRTHSTSDLPFNHLTQLILSGGP